jgi:hypothetical protein
LETSFRMRRGFDLRGLDDSRSFVSPGTKEVERLTRAPIP